MYHIHFNRWKPSEKLTALLAVLLASLTILLRTVPGVSFSANLCLLCMAACLGLLFLSRMGQRRQGWKILLRIAQAALALLVIALAAVEFWVIRTGQRDDAAKPADAVIVLGAGVNGTTPSVALQTRIDAAEAYLKANPGIPAVLSGGRGPGENISEAQAMFNALTARGIDPARLDSGGAVRQYPAEFAKFPAAIGGTGFDSCGGRVAIVTNDFHMARVTLLWNLPAKVVQVPARLPWRWLSANYYLRESFAVVNDLVIRPLLA